MSMFARHIGPINPNHIEMGILPARADNYDFSAYQCRIFGMPHVCNPDETMFLAAKLFSMFLAPHNSEQKQHFGLAGNVSAAVFAGLARAYLQF